MFYGRRPIKYCFFYGYEGETHPIRAKLRLMSLLKPSWIGGIVDTPLIVELIPDPELGGFTARIPDIPAYGEGETEEEAIMDLKEALRAYIEAFGIDDALARANVPLTVRPLDWTLQDLTSPRG